MVELPLLCEIGTWVAECWAALEQYELTAEANYEIGRSNTSALQHTETAYGQAGQAIALQQQMIEFYKEELQREERGRFVDGLFYKTIIGLGLIFIP